MIFSQQIQDYQRSPILKKMKKKINVNIQDVLNKRKRPITTTQQPLIEYNKQNIPTNTSSNKNIDIKSIFDKPLPFEQMYRILNSNKAKDKAENLTYDSKKITPKNSYRSVNSKLSMAHAYTGSSQSHSKKYNKIVINKDEIKDSARSTHSQARIDSLNRKSLYQINKNSDFKYQTPLSNSDEKRNKNSEYQRKSSNHTKKSLHTHKIIQDPIYISENQFNIEDIENNIKQNKDNILTFTESEKLFNSSPKYTPRVVTQVQLKQDEYELKQKKVSHKKTIQAKYNSENNCPWIYQTLSNKIIEQDLDHSLHSHIRSNQCFLSQEQIRYLVKKLGYQIDSEQMKELSHNTEFIEDASQKFQDMLTQLQYDIYGGIPVYNLLKFLKIVDGVFEEGQKQEEQQNTCMLQSHKIINNNLQLVVNVSQKYEIWRYYKSLRASNIMRQNVDSCKKKDKYTQAQAQKIIHSNQFPQKYERQAEFESEDDYQDSDELNNEAEIRKLKDKLNKALEKITSQRKQLSEIQSHYQNNFSPDKLTSNKKPILSVDVNLGQGISEKIIVYQDESARAVSERLAQKYSITEETRQKFQNMLHTHLNSILWKIDQVSEQLLTDRQ